MSAKIDLHGRLVQYGEMARGQIAQGRSIGGGRHSKHL